MKSVMILVAAIFLHGCATSGQIDQTATAHQLTITDPTNIDDPRKIENNNELFTVNGSGINVEK